MPSGLSNRKDNSDAILGQILEGVKKFPGNVAGAPIDLANILANALRASVGVAMSATGTKASDLPDLDDNPVGGSKWINEKFGLKSTGTADEITQAVTGLISPSSGIASAAKIPALLKAMIVPAIALDARAAATTNKFLRAGADPAKVYEHTGMFEGLEQYPQLKAVLPDTNATLQAVGGVLRTAEPNRFYSGPTNLQSTTTKLSPQAQFLPDVLNHPELFEAMPALRDVKIKARDRTGSGAYYPDTKTIEIGPGTGTKGATNLRGQPADIDADEQFMSVLLHETQHAVQYASGFMGGGNPGMFLRDASKIDKAIDKAKSYPHLMGSTNRTLLEGLKAQAQENYMNLGGELEAQIVQAQRKNPELLKLNPADIAIKQAGGKDKIIDPKKVEFLDDDPTIQELLKYYEGI